MGQVTAGSTVPLDILDLDVSDLLDGTVVVQTSTTYTLDLGDGFRITFTGVGFTYDGAGDPIGGTITSISDTVNGATYFSMTGLNFSVSRLVYLATNKFDALARHELLAGNDEVRGGNLDDYLWGFDGHDNLYGGVGADSIQGGDGNDHIWGDNLTSPSPDDGRDVILGGAGSDYIQGNAGDDVLDGGDGSDRIVGGRGNDYILGGDGNDSINGNLGNDDINAGNGNDIIRGGQGDDLLLGSAGNDILMGDLGNDDIFGGTGADVLTGGDGTDFFYFTDRAAAYTTEGLDAYVVDRITDFRDGTDRLVLGFQPAAILTGSASGGGVTAIAQAQSLLDAHTGSNEVAAIQVGSDTYLFFSSFGGDIINSGIQLTNISINTLSTSDFL